MLKFLAILVFICGICFAKDEIHQESNVRVETEADNEVIVKFLTKQLKENRISADAGWELFSSLMDGELRDKMLIFINILSEAQKMNPNSLGYRIGIRGVFIRDCSAVLSIPSEKLVGKYGTQVDQNNREESIFSMRELFLGFHNGDVERLK